MKAIGFNAPITTYSHDYYGNITYTAYSLTDDDYILRPNEAFFVQAPDGVSDITFGLSGKQTVSTVVTQAKPMRRVQGTSERNIVDLTVSNGEGSDRTRVVMNEDEDIIELVNPEIIAAEGEQTGLEGCLSIPGKFGIVTRPYTVRVRAQDRDGNFFEVEDEELTARCFCHEIEHLDGHLFVEHTDHLMTEEELEEYMNQQEEDEE